MVFENNPIDFPCYLKKFCNFPFGGNPLLFDSISIHILTLIGLYIAHGFVLEDRALLLEQPLNIKMVCLNIIKSFYLRTEIRTGLNKKYATQDSTNWFSIDKIG